MKLKVVIILTLTCVQVVGGYTYKYVGCYNDNPISRALSGSMFSNYVGNSIPYCVSQCAKQGYIYAGLQQSYLCFCGNSGYDRYGETYLCFYVCPGNLQERCGGMLHNSVYKVVESTTQDVSTTQGSVHTAAGSVSTTQGSVPTAAGSTSTTQVSDGSTQTKLADPSTSTAASETATNHAETLVSNDGLSTDGTASPGTAETIGIIVGTVVGVIIELAVVLRVRKLWCQKSCNTIVINNRTTAVESGQGPAAADANLSNIGQVPPCPKDCENDDYQTGPDNKIREL